MKHKWFVFNYTLQTHRIWQSSTYTTPVFSLLLSGSKPCSFMLILYFYFNSRQVDLPNCKLWYIFHLGIQSYSPCIGIYWYYHLHRNLCMPSHFFAFDWMELVGPMYGTYLPASPKDVRKNGQCCAVTRYLLKRKWLEGHGWVPYPPS